MSLRFIIPSIIALSILGSCTSDPQLPDLPDSEETTMPEGTHKYTNALIYEKSPYLQQHAHNPVDWHPWGEAAFNRAKAEQKPIFLSIGYSTCHWCHVMEHESFEDEETAKLLNDSFISIKVDREERPDIDSIYMTVCQMLTGSGGWPLTIVMTPDKEPFFAATYISKNSVHGRMGMMQLLPRLSDAWENRRGDIKEAAKSIAEGLAQFSNRDYGGRITEDPIEIAARNMKNSFDPLYGGFSKAPKFPSPHRMQLLLRSWHREDNREALDMVEKTMGELREGGIYDHLGFGFHRYSTDGEWKVPHFEKMLYDQAMMMSLVSDLHTITGDGKYRDIIDEIYTYVHRDMEAPEGGFYSAEDADSEGEEGLFYIWEKKELAKILSQAELAFLVENYHVLEEGNYHDEATGSLTGKNILYLSNLDDKMAEPLREKLFEARKTRIPPLKDKKILTDWNGLMIAALSRAYLSTGDKRYIKSAEGAANFLLENMYDGGSLKHRYLDGESAHIGTLDDYAFLTWGLLELYSAAQKIPYLEKAVSLIDYTLDNFEDAKNGGFFLNAKGAEKLLIRPKELFGGAAPSGNSVMLYNLIAASRLTGNIEYEAEAIKGTDSLGKLLNDVPSQLAYAAMAWDFARGPTREIIVLSENEDDDFLEILRSIRALATPYDTLVTVSPDTKKRLAKIIPFIQDYKVMDGKPTVYVCSNKTCSPPVTEKEELVKLLQSR